eukprot:5362583-Prymnesium_polylepis.2
MAALSACSLWCALDTSQARRFSVAVRGCLGPARCDMASASQPQCGCRVASVRVSHADPYQTLQFTA